MSKASYDRAMHHAVKLQGSNPDRKTFNMEMRREFPRITDYMLHKTRKDSKLLIAYQAFMKDHHEETT